MALYYSDNSLNLMTLGGLALITGPLIDKAVVALENIERYLEMGLSVLRGRRKRRLRDDRSRFSWRASR